MATEALVDWEDDVAIHFIGTVVRDEVFSNLYRGYLYSIKFWATVEHGFSNSVHSNCHGCDICPETMVCLSTECAWNEFFNGEDC